MENLSSSETEFLVEFQVICYNERLKRIHQQKVLNLDLTLQERIFSLIFVKFWESRKVTIMSCQIILPTMIYLTY